MSLQAFFTHGLSLLGSHNLEVAGFLFLICFIGEAFAIFVPYLLETTWVSTGYLFSLNFLSAAEKMKLAEGLAYIHPQAAVARLTALFNDQTPIVRATALQALCVVDSASAPVYTEKALADSDFVVSAVAVEQSVATPIEQQMSGVDNMIYMYSVNANNGQMTLRVDFDGKLGQFMLYAVRKVVEESTNPKLNSPSIPLLLHPSVHLRVMTKYRRP
jgi:hypothetical protein